MGCVIELKSITYAIKARELLRKSGFKAKVEKSGGKHFEGCSYSVAVTGDCQRATRLLKNAKFEILGVT